MSETDVEILKMVRESKHPELMAQYMFNLCLDFLRTHDPVEETSVSCPQESA